MEPWILVILLVLGVPIFLAAWLIVRVVQARNQIDALTRRLGELELEFFRLKKETSSSRATAPAAAPRTTQEPQPVPQPEKVFPASPALPPAVPPPVAPALPPKPVFIPQSIVARPAASAGTQPPFISPTVAAGTKESSALESFTEQAARGKINWEQFMGVKGLAWPGGLVLFLAVAFFVKYSFDNNLVPPQLRVAIGFVVGLGLLVGGTCCIAGSNTPSARRHCAPQALSFFTP